MEKKFALLFFACLMTMKVSAQFNDPVGEVYYYVEETPSGMTLENNMLAFSFNNGWGCLLNAYNDATGGVHFYTNAEWGIMGGNNAKFRLSLIRKRGFTMKYKPTPSNPNIYVYEDKYRVKTIDSVSERDGGETTITYEFSDDRVYLKVKMLENSRAAFRRVTIKNYILSRADFNK